MKKVRQALFVERYTEALSHSAYECVALALFGCDIILIGTIQQRMLGIYLLGDKWGSDSRRCVEWIRTIALGWLQALALKRNV